MNLEQKQLNIIRDHIYEDTDIIFSSKIVKIFNNKSSEIQKAIYDNYIYQTKKSPYFFVQFVKIFLYTIRDDDILLKYLQLKLGNSDFADEDMKLIISLINFLKIYYSEDDILFIFKEIENINKVKVFFINFLPCYESYEHIVNNINIPIKCNLESIQCKIMEYAIENKRYPYYQIFEYSKEVNKACIVVDNYTIKLPSSAIELYEWSKKLNNEIVGYYQMVENSNLHIYGFFKDNELVFIVKNGVLHNMEVSAICYNKLSASQNSIFKKWLQIIEINT